MHRLVEPNRPNSQCNQDNVQSEMEIRRITENSKSYNSLLNILKAGVISRMR